MPIDSSKIEAGVKDNRDSLEDIGLRSNKGGDFLAALSAHLDIELPMRVKSAPAADEFLYSVAANHSQALQGVKADELLDALFEDLHSSRMSWIDVYKQEKPLVAAGEFDEEDLARHETLGRRIQTMEKSIGKVADLKQQPEENLATFKTIVEVIKQLALNKTKRHTHSL